MPSTRLRRSAAVAAVALGLAGLVTAVAPGATAAPVPAAPVPAAPVPAAPVPAAPVPAAPAAVHPDGRSAFETAAASPVGFEVDAPAGDPVTAGATAHVVVQHGTTGAWATVADVHGDTPRLVLPEGSTRWRARFETTDGTAGPWTPWIAFTVDSRTPTAPQVSLPAGNPSTGVPVALTVTSPDGLAGVVVVSAQSVAPVFARGEDPCAVVGAVCLPAGRTSATIPWTFLGGGSPVQVWATAYGRNGLASPTVRTTGSGSDVPDTTAAATATRWPIPTTGGRPATVQPTNGGTSLRIAPTLVTTTQQVYVGGGGDDRARSGAPAVTTAAATDGEVPVPSAVVTADTTVRTTATVLDTASAFSVGGVFTIPTTAHSDLTVLGQTGAGGPAASLVLTSGNGWRFCVYRRDGSAVCAGQSGPPPGSTDTVTGRWDPVQDAVGIVVDEVSSTSGSGVRFAPRAANGALAVGAATVPGTGRYVGPVGSPFVARGWLTPDQATALVTSSP